MAQFPSLDQICSRSRVSLASLTDPFFTANGLKAGATLPITQNYRDITIVVVARRWRETSAVTCQLRFETLIAESERIVVYLRVMCA